MHERTRLLLVAVVALLLIPPAPAGAAQGDVSGAELRRLARAAEADPAARARLGEVRRVDGRPVDMRVVLDTADEDALRSRLRTLASGAESGSGAPGPVDPAGEGRARQEARRILDDRDFKPAAPPRPFRGALRRLGEWLRPLIEPLGRRLGPLVDSILGQWVLALLVLIVAAVLARRLVERRTASAIAEGGRRRGGGSGRHDDPDALDRAAEAAERAGDLDAAVRLRFRAGVLRLDRRGAVEVRPSTTTGQLVRRVPSAALHELAATFEAVAYGGRAAGPDDVAAARAQWPRVLEEATRS